MSFIQLNADTRQYHVKIPHSKKLPPNPHIGGGLAELERALASPSVTVDTNSELNQEFRDNKRLRHLLLATDQRSFFTGSAAADLQAAHIINANRGNAERKRQVEAYLTQQKLHHPMLRSFVLDSPYNAILLEASLHVQWVLYGTFCFVPAEKDANAMLHELHDSNAIWQQNQDTLAALHQDAIRPLDISKQPFARPRWEIVVLHPGALLPDNQPLAIAQNRSLYRKGQTESPTTPTWKFWVLSGDRLSSLEEPDEHLGPYLAIDLRDEFVHPPLCSLAMVINAHCKLEEFLKYHGTSASNRVKTFGRLMSELVTEIFFVPEDGYVSVALPLSQPETAPASIMAGAYPTQSVPQGSHRQFTFPIPGYSHDLTSNYVIEDTDPTVENSFHGEVEAPEISDADGLTNSEFRLVASKANDPHLNAKERTDAAMMMLFGTRRYADPYDHAL